MLVLVGLVTLMAVPAVIAAHLFAGCGGEEALEAAPTDSDAYVDLVGRSFVDRATGSSSTEIEAGGSVTFVWTEQYCHSVTQSTVIDMIPLLPNGPKNQLNNLLFGERFDSGPGLQEPDFEQGADSVTFTFAEPGVYTYLCRHHSGAGMTGTITVT